MIDLIIRLQFVQLEIFFRFSGTKLIFAYIYIYILIKQHKIYRYSRIIVNYPRAFHVNIFDSKVLLKLCIVTDLENFVCEDLRNESDEFHEYFRMTTKVLHYTLNFMEERLVTLM